jgi:hypothetical protein
MVVTNATNDKELEIGDIISLDDENGELLGDFEVIALFDLNNKQYVALTDAIDEEEADDDTEEEIDIFVFEVDGGELVPLAENDEAAAYAKLNEILEGIELVDSEEK